MSGEINGDDIARWIDEWDCRPKSCFVAGDSGGSVYRSQMLAVLPSLISQVKKVAGQPKGPESISQPILRCGLTVESFRKVYPEPKLAIVPDKRGINRLVGFGARMPAGALKWCRVGDSEWKSIDQHDRETKPLLFGDDDDDMPTYKGE